VSKRNVALREQLLGREPLSQKVAIQVADELTGGHNDAEGRNVAEVMEALEVTGLFAMDGMDMALARALHLVTTYLPVEWYWLVREDENEGYITNITRMGPDGVGGLRLYTTTAGHVRPGRSMMASLLEAVDIERQLQLRSQNG
jgi:hypothetical protein